MGSCTRNTIPADCAHLVAEVSQNCDRGRDDAHGRKALRGWGHSTPSVADDAFGDRIPVPERAERPRPGTACTPARGTSPDEGRPRRSAPLTGAASQASFEAAVPLVAVLAAAFFAVVFFAAVFLAVVFLAVVLRVVRFLAGPLARFSASSS